MGAAISFLVMVFIKTEYILLWLGIFYVACLISLTYFIKKSSATVPKDSLIETDTNEQN